MGVFRSTRASPPKRTTFVAYFQSRTGELLIALPGSRVGTRTAEIFVVNPNLMERAMRDASPDWPEKSIQVLLHAPTIGQIPGPPEVVAVHVW